MKYKISNSTLPVLHIDLDKGETVYSESGGMAWMDNNISMDSRMGGIGKAIGRIFSGESLFKVYYTAQKSAGITFCSEFPGQILPLDLKDNESMICQKDAFMCAESSVDLKVHFSRKLRAGFFGGEGFILQEVTGPGIAFLEFDGELTKRKLKAGEIIKVDPGYIGAFEPTVTHSIEMVKGIKNIFFGGEVCS